MGTPQKVIEKLTVLSFYDPVEFWRLCEEIWEVDFPDKWLSFRMSTLEKTFLLPSSPSSAKSYAISNVTLWSRGAAYNTFMSCPAWNSSKSSRLAKHLG